MISSLPEILTALSVVFILFVLLTCVFESFDNLSGGRIRKIEEKNAKLAEQLEKWTEDAAAIRSLLKIMLYVFAALTGCCTWQTVKMLFPDLPVNCTAAVITVSVTAAALISEIIAFLLPVGTGITMLRFAIPIPAKIVRALSGFFSGFSRSDENAPEEHQEEEKNEEAVSVEDEILSYVDGDSSGEAENDLEEGEKKMIRGILDLDETYVRFIMTPRVDLDAIPADAAIEEAKAMFIKTGRSRIPVYEGNSVDCIKGIIYAKDFLDDEKLKGKKLTELAHQAIFIPETKNVGGLLEEIKKSHNHFAVVIDEYGGTSGIVTFEDIIEEIVGSIQDEYDKESDMESEPRKMPDGSFQMEGRILLDKFCETLDLDLPDDEDNADTIGGYVCQRLGRIPAQGETYTEPGKFQICILQADERKIDMLSVIPLCGADEEKHGK